MRTGLLLPALATVVLVSALAVAGCASEEAASPAATGAPEAATGYTTVDVRAAHDALSADADAQLLDVREPSEWAETGVPQGAALIPLGDLASRAASELATDRPVYVICRSGNRSRTAGDILVGLGFTEVYNVDGGVTDWVAAGLPVEPYRP